MSSILVNRQDIDSILRALQLATDATTKAHPSGDHFTAGFEAGYTAALEAVAEAVGVNEKRGQRLLGVRR